MNRVELVNALSRKTGLPKTDVEKTIEALVQTVTETLQAGGEVTIAGFGSFLSRLRKGRSGVLPRNPSQKIEIPPVRVAKFRVGVNLKKALRQ